jgi:hypothetical protein
MGAPIVRIAAATVTVLVIVARIAVRIVAGIAARIVVEGASNVAAVATARIAGITVDTLRLAGLN